MADRERAARWAEAVEAQLDGLSNAEASARLHAKIMDLLARGAFDGKERDETVRMMIELIRPDSIRLADRMLKRFDELVNLANTMYRNMGPDVSRNLPKIEQIEAVAMNRIGQYSKTMSRKIAGTVRKGLAEDWTVEKLGRAVKSKTNLSRVVSETIARTQVKGYGNGLKGEKARIAGVPFSEYVGFLRGNTREFCRVMLNVTLHVDDVRKLNNGQGLSVLTYCGGYNCHHFWEPDPEATKGTKGVIRTRQTGPKRSITYWERRG